MMMYQQKQKDSDKAVFENLYMDKEFKEEVQKISST